MRTRNEYIHLLRSQEAVLRQDYGIRSLRLFGSVVREQQIIAYNMLKQYRYLNPFPATHEVFLD